MSLFDIQHLGNGVGVFTISVKPMKLFVGLLIAGLSVPAMPQSAHACFICNPIKATKATIKRPSRGVQAVTDPIRIIINSSSGQMGGRQESTADMTTEELVYGPDDQITIPGQSTGSLFRPGRFRPKLPSWMR